LNARLSLWTSIRPTLRWREAARPCFLLETQRFRRSVKPLEIECRVTAARFSTKIGGLRRQVDLNPAGATPPVRLVRFSCLSTIVAAALGFDSKARTGVRRGCRKRNPWLKSSSGFDDRLEIDQEGPLQ
jgi:hypothetical protein